MFDNLAGFFIQWAITAASLWVASLLFNGIRFSGTSALIISALLLGFANAVLRPLLVILPLPLTLSDSPTYGLPATPFRTPSRSFWPSCPSSAGI